MKTIEELNDLFEVLVRAHIDESENKSYLLREIVSHDHKLSELNERVRKLEEKQ